MKFYDYQENPTKLERGVDNLGYLIKLLADSLDDLIGEQMREFELTATQWYPIVVIGLQKADTPAAVANMINVDTGAMTRTLDRLEKKGFLQRSRCTEDRRVIKLALTNKGKQVTSKLFPAAENALNKLFRGFSQAEFELLQNMLLRMLVNISRDNMHLMPEIKAQLAL